MYSRFLKCHLISISALVLSFFSCMNQQTTYPTIEIDSPTGTIEIKISDLLSDITIVPLETRDELLFSAGMSFIVTNNYVLVITDKALIQFNRQGKFIRTLATKGNGPNEYNTLTFPLIDEEREILYYTQYEDNIINCINLRNGEFKEPLYLNVSCFSINSIDSEGNIYGFPKEKNSHLLAFKYNPANKNIIYYKGFHSSVSENTHKVMFKEDNQIHFLSFSYSDTLFKVEGKKIIPKYIVKMHNLEKGYKGGVNLWITIPSTQGTIFHKMETQVQRDENSMYISSFDRGYLFLDKSGALKSIRSITIDPLALIIDIDNYIKKINNRPLSEEIKINPIPIILGSGLWGYYAIEGCHMMSLIEQALDNKLLSSDQRIVLEGITGKIKEDSNPVLIIGKVK